LAIALHIRIAMPNGANQARGKQNGQENLEEVEEDRSDEAVAGDQVPVGLFFIVRSAPKGTTRPERSISNGKRAVAAVAAALFET
jgi:hypothetical protein